MGLVEIIFVCSLLTAGNGAPNFQHTVFQLPHYYQTGDGNLYLLPYPTLPRHRKLLMIRIIY